MFNSPQPFPSCSWTAEGLARFISFLGPELQKLNVDLFFGTMERPNEKFVYVALLDPKASKYIYVQVPGIPRRQNLSQMSQGRDRLRAVRVTVSDPKTRKKWGGRETVPP
jgi:hypothetical protein